MDGARRGVCVFGGHQNNDGDLSWCGGCGLHPQKHPVAQQTCGSFFYNLSIIDKNCSVFSPGCHKRAQNSSTPAQAGNKSSFIKAFSYCSSGQVVFGGRGSVLEPGGHSGLLMCGQKRADLRTAATSRGSFEDGGYLEEKWQPPLTSAAARHYVSAGGALGRTSCSV